MTPPQQLPLTLAFRPALSREAFLVSDCNRSALTAIESPGLQRLALSGPEGCGKTHLASIWGERTGAVTLGAKSLNDDNVAALADASAVVIEDCDQLDIAQEVFLFHALNLTRAENVAVLITGRTPPARWRITTPDLASRLAALDHVAIAPPDDILLSSILEKLFSDRRLTIGAGVVTFMVRRMERSFAAAEQAVEQLDRLALSKRRPITRPLAKEMFDAGLQSPAASREI